LWLHPPRRGAPTGAPLGDECLFARSPDELDLGRVQVLARSGRCVIHAYWVAGGFGAEPNRPFRIGDAELRLLEKLIRDCFARARARGLAHAAPAPQGIRTG
jgi:hypothetical protein